MIKLAGILIPLFLFSQLVWSDTCKQGQIQLKNGGCMDACAARNKGVWIPGMGKCSQDIKTEREKNPVKKNGVLSI